MWDSLPDKVYVGDPLEDQRNSGSQIPKGVHSRHRLVTDVEWPWCQEASPGVHYHLQEVLITLEDQLLLFPPLYVDQTDDNGVVSIPAEFL